ncbi:MAG: glycosyltransferase [Magnetovibrio sp.]|nr:glycosyltransferase [Magnetovibrio sp.]
MNADILFALASLSLFAWAVLEFFRGGFWRADQRLGPAGELGHWPGVVAVIPARNEAPTIGRTVASLLGQDYPGQVSVIVVDDGSDDGTAAAAGAAANLRVVPGTPLPSGWTGKLWAVQQGMTAAQVYTPDAVYVLMTDADIEHAPGNLRELVFKAETERLHLVSLMVKLRAVSAWERLLIPAFVFFFQKLYPFPWVNDPASPTAAAAGGCMLIRRDTLDAAGGIEAIRDRLIDDCAMAALIKPKGPIWLGLTKTTRSLRAYETLDEIWDMVARTAFVQLDHSYLAVAGTVAGMALIYLVPPVAALVGLVTPHDQLGLVGVIAWAVMCIAYRPTLALYGEPVWRSLLLPVAAVFYALMTVSSALRHLGGEGGGWKGRHYSSG